jgi:signal transduction histidine kinase
VLANLLNNAAKYTEEGGRIALEVARIGDEAVLRVRDNGIGIAAEMVSRIFDLFIQVDRSPDRAQGGLGVGLTLVRQLVEMHGGSVQVRSDGPHRGSEFVVRLPALPDAAPSASPRPAEMSGPIAPPPSSPAIDRDSTREALPSSVSKAPLGQGIPE